MANFVSITDENGEVTMLNMDRVICVDEIRDAHCRLDFGHGYLLHIEGQGVNALVRNLSVTLDIESSVTCEEHELPEPIDMRQLGMLPPREEL